MSSTQRYLTGLLAIIACCLYSPAATSQETRPLSLWLDTLSYNVCGTKSFQIPIHVGSFLPGDSVIGFRQQDAVSGATIYLSWDPSVLDLDDLALTSGTLAQQSKVVIRKFAREATLEILIGDPDQPLRNMVGAMPLLYLSGSIIAPDTVSGLSGWIQVRDAELTSATRYDTESYRPGFVHAYRDTTAAYTGHLTVTPATFDTLRLDTITISAQNLAARRVNEISFGLKADTTFFVFSDTITSGLSASAQWSVAEVMIRPDSLHVRLVSAAPVTQDGALIQVVLRRTNDSAFESTLRPDEFAVNPTSCLGRLDIGGAGVTAEAIRRDTVTSVVPDAGDKLSSTLEILSGDRESLLVRARGGAPAGELRVYDIKGRAIRIAEPDYLDQNTARIRFVLPVPAGTYIVVLRSPIEIVSKQFNLIQ